MDVHQESRLSDKSGKPFWSLYHSLSSSKQRIPQLISNGSISIDSPVGKANLLNSHFSSCFSTPTVNSGLTHTTRNSVTLDSISCRSTPEEVHTLLLRVKLKTASGPDGISSHMLRNTVASTTVFLSLTEKGTFPESWKMSNVTPILKAGDPKLASNYRPISLLSLPSKDNGASRS